MPQEQLGGRVQMIPQGKVLGGGSSINAQAYMRGRAADYDAWGEIAKTDLWSWETILPHFTRLGAEPEIQQPLPWDERAAQASRTPASSAR